MASKRSIWSKNFILLMAGDALLFMVYNMQVPVLPLYGKSLGMSASQIGLFVGAIMFAAMVVRLFSDRLLHYFKKKTLLIAGVLLYLAASVCYPLFTAFAPLIAFRLLNGIGHGLGTTYFATAAADELPLNRMGEGIGYFGISSMFSASIAPLVALPIAQKISFNAFFLTCILILILAMGMLAFIKPKVKPVVATKKTRLAGIQKDFFAPIAADLLSGFDSKRGAVLHCTICRNPPRSRYCLVLLYRRHCGCCFTANRGKSL
ncbi:MFS transporter [Secundilactobacillus silagei]|uniref:MFS transporter n=1 Tax=Secundilactobacillus silagei TaxID=1293415 RepID=UPI0006D1B1ED|nr:MFS transporter [Secundilactobacillus silagei]